MTDILSGVGEGSAYFLCLVVGGLIAVAINAWVTRRRDYQTTLDQARRAKQVR